MREFVGKTRTGKKVTREVYRHVDNGTVHVPVDKNGREVGWNGDPPPVDGVTVPFVSEAYRQNYDLIDWGHGKGEERHARSQE